MTVHEIYTEADGEVPADIIAFSPNAKVTVVLFMLSLGTWLVSQLNESS